MVLRGPGGATAPLDVTFADADHGLDDELDGQYQAKYRRYAASIIDRINSPQARATTIRLVPR